VSSRQTAGCLQGLGQDGTADGTGLTVKIFDEFHSQLRTIISVKNKHSSLALDQYTGFRKK
jgi:hypothetical protein